MSEAEDAADISFEQGLAEGRLLIQHCASCGVARHPPSPFCRACKSWEVRLESSTGAGVLHSFTIVERPAYPGVPVPHVIGLVDLDDMPVRILAPLVVEDEPVIGMKVGARFERRPPATIDLVFAGQAR